MSRGAACAPDSLAIHEKVVGRPAGVDKNTTMDPIETDRLRLRPLRTGDAAVIHAYRNSTATAEYQTWKLPYTVEQAERLIGDVSEIGGIVAGHWYALGIELAATGELIGDLAVHRHDTFPTAEIGYTLAPEHQRRGLATEAVEALISHLFEVIGLWRLEAMLDPRNIDSEMMLERVGFLYEGNRVESYFNDPEWSDDGVYGMRRADWTAWRSRPRHGPQAVHLVSVTPDNLRTVLALRTHHSQERFVGPVVKSLADAAVPPVENGQPLVPWFRAIEADGELAGFVMLARATAALPTTWLWRLLIDRRHQRRGIGSQVVDQICTMLRESGERALKVSYVPGRGTPAPLYLRRGFVPTGEMEDDEIVLELKL
jgi:RimJ/RimL family protein N-acetyltransferase